MLKCFMYMYVTGRSDITFASVCRFLLVEYSERSTDWFCLYVDLEEQSSEVPIDHQETEPGTSSGKSS